MSIIIAEESRRRVKPGREYLSDIAFSDLATKAKIVFKH